MLSHTKDEVSDRSFDECILGVLEDLTDVPLDSPIVLPAFHRVVGEKAMRNDEAAFASISSDLLSGLNSNRIHRWEDNSRVDVSRDPQFIADDLGLIDSHVVDNVKVDL
jgi:hypothetical protein